MNNNKWKNNKRGHGGQGWPKNNGFRKSKNRTQNIGSEGRDGCFKKFVDDNHNDSTCRPQNVWDCDNNRNKNSVGNENGIYPWIRKNPFNPLIIPQHINFDQQYDCDNRQETHNNNRSEVKEQHEQQLLNNPFVSQESEKEKSVPRSGKDSVSTANPISEATETSKLPIETGFTVKIKRETEIKNVKQEKKSSSEETVQDAKSISANPEVIPFPKKQTSPLNIKLKPKTDSVNSTPPKLKSVLESSSKAASSSSSSSGVDSEPIPPPKTATTMDNKQKVQITKKNVKPTKAVNNKNGSEDDVVCIGKLENKIVLEDESDSNYSEDEEHQTVKQDKSVEKIVNKKQMKSVKKAAEKCMICDKKGHTSFQCQMICKNCSAPYHGYRTCPQPANLNIMMQLFIEFCMQQFQHFNAEKQMATTFCESVPKPQVDSPHSVSGGNKLSKLKRKQVKASVTKASKKFKMSTSKKKSKRNDDDSSDDDNDGDDTDSESSSTESEVTSDSSTESLVSSKRKRKMKSKIASKAVSKLSKFSTNPVNLPMVLNSFPRLTVPTPSVQDPNALNTLLLTQMFQNAIGSLK